MKKTKRQGIDHIFMRSINERYYEQQTGEISPEKAERIKQLHEEIEQIKKEKAQLEAEVEQDRAFINGLKDTAETFKKQVKKHSKGDNENER